MFEHIEPLQDWIQFKMYLKTRVYLYERKYAFIVPVSYVMNM